MAERSIEIGGEVLKVGDTVVIRGLGRRGDVSDEALITKIGTKYIHLRSNGRETQFSIETRQDAVNTRGVPASFRTRTEVAQIEKRQSLVLRLYELGFQPTDKFRNAFGRYDDEVLERVIAVLSENENSEK